MRSRIAIKFIPIPCLICPHITSMATVGPLQYLPILWLSFLTAAIFVAVPIIFLRIPVAFRIFCECACVCVWREVCVHFAGLFFLWTLWIISVYLLFFCFGAFIIADFSFSGAKGVFELSPGHRGKKSEKGMQTTENTNYIVRTNKHSGKHSSTLTQIL